ncbi:MAG: hypothetical protein PHU71_04380 [Candidatus Gracilibacteria bacterium]|nr:hypothetical protein [Candidatus Gracilibacteria bacterium]
MKHRIKGGILAIIGYMLSPLSWWNDLVINIPLAYAFAFPFGLISRNLFLPMMIFGYWITNVVGFILMHHGAKDIVSKEKVKYTRKELIKDIIISIIYTLLVVVFVRMGWLKFPLEYFE